MIEGTRTRKMALANRKSSEKFTEHAFISNANMNVIINLMTDKFAYLNNRVGGIIEHLDYDPIRRP